MPTLAAAFSPDMFRANWLRRNCFVWWQRPEDAEEFGLWILSHRDSGLIDQSNGAAILKRLSKFEESGDVIIFDCSHWLVGTTHEMGVRVYRPGGSETTAAFEELAEIVEALDQYPILDETDYGEREYESALEGIRLALLGSDIDENTLPEGWESEVYGWLSDHEPSEVENADDRGAFPDRDAVKRALIARGLTNEEEVE